jgi:hypothetical protein
VKQRRLLWVGLLAVLLLAILAGWRAGLPHHWGQRVADFDMVNILRQLQQANADIGEANAEILVALAAVQREAEGVGRVHERLLTLETGLHDQEDSLTRLLALTAEQANLSRSLRDLTGRVSPSTAGMARTAELEAVAIEGMGATTARLAGMMREIEATNRATLAKLQRAEHLSAQVLTRMP